MFAKQFGWQEILVRLLIVKKSTSPLAKPLESCTDSNQNQQAGMPLAIKISPSEDSLQNNSQSGDSIQSLPTPLDQSDDFLQAMREMDDTTDAPDIFLESFSTPRFERPNIFDLQNSDDDCTGELQSRSSSTSTEDLIHTPVSQKRSQSLGVLPELTQEDAENLLSEPATSKSVGDLVSKARSESSPALKTPQMPSPVMSLRSRRESCGSDISLSSSQQEQDLAVALRKMGLSVKCDDNMEMNDDLTQNLLILIFTVMWKGVENSDTAAWKVNINIIISFEMF